MVVPIIPVRKPQELPAQGTEKPTPAPIAYPEDQNCYLVGSNGLFHQVRNPYYEIRYSVKGVSTMASVDANVKLHVTKMPV